MNDLIRSIEAEQLKASVDDFAVGDTVRVHNKIREGNRERVQFSRDKTVVQERLSQLERTQTVSVLRRHGHYTLHLLTE